ncbi:DUF3088 domain-containing protein [Xanthobacter sp. V4C-4]|uniref:DUF3088 domain-containing protein n=1 Tax=Xanthobacter cornucopiae TaxID=3119924 RepID=UPI00372AA09F
MSRDRLILITPGFSDPASPGRTFFCPDCNQVEGLLASHPALLERIDVERVPFARPRAAVIAVLGADNQGLPVLILGDAAPPPADALSHGEFRFVTDTRRILELIAERHGVPFPH